MSSAGPFNDVLTSHRRGTSTASANKINSNSCSRGAGRRVDLSDMEPAHTDVVVAAAEAFVNALNRLVAGTAGPTIHPQRDMAELDSSPVH